jgi:hypothetical protein
VLGWADGDCDACDTLGGVYVLDYSAADSGLGDCVWKYEGDPICTRIAGCGTEQSGRLTITATLNSSCRWDVIVAFEMLEGDDSCEKPRKVAQYRLSNSDEEDCDAMAIPFLSNLATSNVACSGSYNATIELSR